MKRVDFYIAPYVLERGYLFNVPDEIFYRQDEEALREYLFQHFDEVELEEVERDYRGCEIEFDKE